MFMTHGFRHIWVCGGGGADGCNVGRCIYCNQDGQRSHHVCHLVPSDDVDDVDVACMFVVVMTLALLTARRMPSDRVNDDAGGYALVALYIVLVYGNTHPNTPFVTL